jgi:hypothetical protein
MDQRGFCRLFTDSVIAELALILVLPFLGSLCLCLFLEETYVLPRDTVNILQVAAEIATLSKSLHAFRAGEWALAGMFAEVVAQIAALFEDGTTVRVATFEI